MSKIKLDVIKPWIQDKLTEILKIDDDVVVDFVYNQLDEKFPDPKKIQINLTGFLHGKNAREFMAELWALLISAQDNPSGIPDSLIDKKREELIIKKVFSVVNHTTYLNSKTCNGFLIGKRRERARKS